MSEDYQKTLVTLKARKASLCCNEVVKLLEDLGFTVDSKTAGHKVFTHRGLPEFYSGSFNCGHGKNPEIKPAYITNLLRTLSMHEVGLKKFLEDKND